MKTPLMQLIWDNDPINALALIATGRSDPENVDTSNAKTALIYACIKGIPMSDVALALIETGDSNPEMWDGDGKTALIYACEKEMSDVALALIRNGDSNPTQVDDNGRTALSYAQEHETMQEVVELLLQVAPPVARVEVNAIQVHQAASKIDYKKLKEFFSTRTPQPTTIPQKYADYIKDTINTLITESDEPPETKEKLKADLERIYVGRLKGLNYSEKSKIILESIINSLEYVKLQPTVFKKMYVETFVQDCVHAYEGADGMTCAGGALERIIFSLVPACKTSDNPDYTTLIHIIIGPELIINSIMDWHKLHNPKKPENVGAVAFPPEREPGVDKIKRQDDLRQYLLGLYPDLSDLIEQLIISHAEFLGYEDDDFIRGGKRRNSRKRRKRRINKTRKKSYKKSYKKITRKLQEKKVTKKVTKKL